MEWINVIQMPVIIILSLGCGFYFYRLSSFFVDYHKNKLVSAAVTVVFGITSMTPVLGTDPFNITALVVLHGIMLLFCAAGSAANRIAVLLLFFPIIIAANYITYNNPVYGKIQMLGYSGSFDSHWRTWYLPGIGALKLGIAYLLWRMFKKRVVEIKRYLTKENWFRIGLLCLAHLEQFEKEAPIISGRCFCADKALNAVIDSRYTRMLEEGIDTHFNISIGTIWGIDIFDLCTIFANALDNALEASPKVMDKGRRKVELRVKDEKGIFSFHLMNYKENSITEKGGMLLSDKENEKEHGFVLFLYMRS